MIRWVSNRMRRSPVICYFVLAFGFSWAIELLLIANYNHLIDVPPALHYLTSFGPALAAFVVAGALSGRRGMTELFKRVLRWNIGLKWLLVACISPLLLAGLAVTVNYALTTTWPDISLLGQVEYLGNIGLPAALLSWVVTFGFNEEIGWRGFAFQTLRDRKWGPLPAAVIVGILWALWHLPSFFYKPTMMALGTGGFIGFAIGVVSGSVLLAWLYEHAGGSIAAVAMWHALFDFTVASPAGEGTVAAITSTGVMVWAALIVVADLRQMLLKRKVDRRTVAHQAASGSRMR